MLEISNYKISAVHTNEKMKEVEELVFQQYKVKKFCSERFEVNFALNIKNKITLAAYDEYQNLIATVSLAFDVENKKLPCEHVFKDELLLLRQKRRKLVEMTKLTSVKGKEDVLFYLFILSFLFTQKALYSDMIAMIETKHLSYYEGRFGFSTLDIPRIDTQAGDILSSLIKLDVTSAIKSLLIDKNKRTFKLLLPMFEQGFLEIQKDFIEQELSQLDLFTEKLNAMAI